MLTFFGAFRISEVVASGKENKSRIALQWQDVKIEDEKVRILIWRSKVDQWGKGTQITLGQYSICKFAPLDLYRHL